jgi:hypothetical protein
VTAKITMMEKGSLQKNRLAFKIPDNAIGRHSNLPLLNDEQFAG